LVGLKNIFTFDVIIQLNYLFVKYLLLFFSTIFFTICNAQHLYEKVITDASIHVGYDIITTSDRCYVITGFSNPTNSIGGAELCVIKIDSLGDVLWANNYGNYYDEFGYGIIETIDSNYVISGSTDDTTTAANGTDAYLLKVSKNNGTVIWDKIWSYSDYNVGYDLVEDPLDSSLIVVGYKHSFVTITKVNFYGDTLWRNILENDSAGLLAVTISNTGEIICAGVDLTPTGEKGMVMKFDASGNLLWKSSFYSGLGERLEDVLVMDDGTIYACGYSTIDSQNTLYDGILRKIDTNGNLIYYETFGDDKSNEFLKMTYNEFYNQLIMSGSNRVYSNLTGQQNSQIYLVNFPLDGSEVNEYTYGDSLYASETGYAICNAHDGGYILSGMYSWGGAIGLQLIKVNEQGSVVSVIPIVLNNENVTVYPSPSRDIVYIEWDTYTALETEIYLYNSRGQLVFQDNVAFNHFQIDCTVYPKGTYFIVLKNDETTTTKKLII